VDAVLNWLWQGSAVAIAAAVLLRMIGPARARVRYAMLWVAWLSVLALPLAPLAWASVISPDASVDLQTSSAMVSIPMSALWNSVLVVLWAMWSVVFGGRLVVALVALRTAKRSCRPLPYDREARLRFWTVVSAAGRRTSLVLSNEVRSAAVLGCGSPLIVVAPTLLQSLEDEELDRIVIHEWAHVQRYDDVSHLLQLLGRVVAGWHPAMWWLDRQLHLEREVACDEAVVAITGSAKSYASCLTKVASLPAAVRSLPAVGALSSSGLRPRIERILRLGRSAPSPSRWLHACAAGLVLCVMAIAVSATRLVETTLLADDLIQDSSPSTPVAAVQTEVNTASTPRDSSRPRPEVGRRTVPPAGRKQPTPVSNKGTDRLASSDSGKNLAPFVASRSIDALTTSGTSAPAVAVNGLDVSSSGALPASGVSPVSPWATAADAGVVIGRKSQGAAVATAGFFTRFGRSIAGSF
jgi:beta-lactamase regulating signal transducer with metallopeptidase domain